MFILFALISVCFAKSDPNCASAYCSSCDATKCTGCIDDYVLVNGECKYCRDAVENCRYALNGKCTTCFSGYFARDGQCFEVDPNCEKYNNGKCAKCHDGYKLTNGACEKCKVLGCEECDRDVAVCQECMDGYALVNNECIQPVPNCEEYRDGTQTCEECMHGYRLEKGKCVKIEQNNCMTMENGVCTKCFGPYIPVNGKCESTNGAVSVIEHCIEYDEDGEFECEKCEPGYYTNEQENQCLKCDASCKTCDDRATECETCAEGYYVNEQDKCVKCPIESQDCAAFTREELCFQCNNKCNWNNGKCVESHCAVYEEAEDDPKCMKCEKGYVLARNEKVCVQSVDGCKEKVGEKCVECERGYFITEDFKCQECNSNCRTCVYKADNCHSCTKESRVTENSCLDCAEEDCLSCPKSPNVCAVCSGNMTVNEIGTCKQGCFSEDCNGKCTMCSDDVNNMNVKYPPTEEGVCLKYAQMPNTPGALSAGYSMMVLFVAVLLLII